MLLDVLLPLLQALNSCRNCEGQLEDTVALEDTKVLSDILLHVL